MMKLAFCFEDLEMQVKFIVVAADLDKAYKKAMKFYETPVLCAIMSCSNIIGMDLIVLFD